MRKILFTLMMSMALLSLGGCKTAPQKRELANAEAVDPYVIPDFNYKLSDIKTAGVTKERLFAELDPDRIILNTASVCSNRALLWGWNMKRKYNIDSGKIFVFYSRGFFMDPEYHELTGGAPAVLEPGEAEEKQWWYHVAPYVVEDGKEWVLDHGFLGSRRETPPYEVTTAWRGRIDRPLTPNEWLLRFARSAKCQEIGASDTDLTDYMRRGSAFPHPRDGGKARCYFRKIPMTYWTPLSVAMKELNKNGAGEVLRYPFLRDTHYEADILTACEEAVSEDSGLARLFGRKAKMRICLKYLGFDQPIPSYAPFVGLDGPLDRDLKKLKKRRDKALKQIARGR